MTRATAEVGPLPHPEAQRAELVGPVPCEQFALCDREAELALPHPVLGPVATCSRCAARVARLGLGAEPYDLTDARYDDPDALPNVEL